MNQRKTNRSQKSRYTSDYRRNLSQPKKQNPLVGLFNVFKPKPKGPSLDKLVKTQKLSKKEEVIKRRSNDSKKTSSELPKSKKSQPLTGPLGFLWQLLKFLAFMISLPFQLIFFPFKALGKVILNLFTVRENLILASFLTMFLLISFRFAQLQLLSADSQFGLGRKIELNNSSFITAARRGEIYITDLSQNKDNIPLTASQIEFDIFFDGKNLQSNVAKGLDVEEAALEVASRVNLPYTEVRQMFVDEVSKENPSQSVILARNIDQNQKQSIEYLRSSALNRKFSFTSWIGTTEKQTRNYPENKLLAATVGYTPKFPQASSEIESRFRSCLPMVQNNRARGTDTGQYIVGSYGLEQKFCSTLGGLNGKQFTSATEGGENTQVVNGAELHLTIDINLQREAERLLQQAVIANSNENGKPKNGSIIVMEVQTGKMLAMASYPFFDPNEFERYWVENPQAFRNASTSVDYDIGSVMKPITVAAALNTHQSGVVIDGKLKGVPPDYTFPGYGEEGKVYQEINGNQFFIQNADDVSYGPDNSIPLKDIVRDSINTGIADVVDETSAEILRQYYTERFKLGSETLISLPGDEHGNIVNFDNDIGCAFCWANFGFGQGFTVPPLQVARAYTALANKGRLVEPYLVERIEYSDGSVDTINEPGSLISQPEPEQIISESTANLVTQYMQAVIEEGYLGSGEANPAKVDGYYLAGKTGTAEVNRPYQVLDAYGNPLLDENDNPILRPCNFACNSTRGIFDHSFVGYGPVSNPQYLVMVKLSEPRPGVQENFSSETVAPVFSDMMGYTLSYMNVPRDY
jgi:cell division protein FtsI/penicillin-binding protein 2